ncbi:BrnA antitoxin family protein [Bordetella genomosp. 8]|uniref:BrnA antitoxin family protein n=1 Tax=Bordetella genomosp. 8 TaxID=1416806 RepID=UPI0012FDBBFC
MKKHVDRPDHDTPEWTDETTARAVHIDGVPESLQHKLRRPHGLNKAPTKLRASMRLSPDVLETFARQDTARRRVSIPH